MTDPDPVDECSECLDTGWVDCHEALCHTPQEHGAYCDCEIGVQRKYEDDYWWGDT